MMICIVSLLAMEHVVESVVPSGLEGEVILHKRGKYQKNKLSKKKSQSKTRKNVKKQGKFSKQENGKPGSCTQLIQGTYEYAGGCFGSFFRSTISCDGERCIYSEYQIKKNACDENDELFVPNYCSLGGEFKILEEMNEVESSSCKLELIPLIASDMCNYENGVPTHLKASYLEGGDAMQLFFSRDDGKTFYNQRDPRMAVKVSKNTNHGRACDSAKDGAKVYSKLPLSTSTGEIPRVLSDCEQEPINEAVDDGYNLAMIKIFLDEETKYKYNYRYMWIQIEIQNGQDTYYYKTRQDATFLPDSHQRTHSIGAGTCNVQNDDYDLLKRTTEGYAAFYINGRTRKTEALVDFGKIGTPIAHCSFTHWPWQFRAGRTTINGGKWY